MGKRVHAFPKGISLKVNVIVRQVFELTLSAAKLMYLMYLFGFFASVS